jgi:hypothetical protein
MTELGRDDVTIAELQQRHDELERALKAIQVWCAHQLELGYEQPNVVLNQINVHVMRVLSNN